MGRDDHPVGPSAICLSPKNYFTEIVTDALEQRRVRTFPLAQTYLVNILEFYVSAENLFDELDSSGRRSRETLAELFLKAVNANPMTRIELLKKLADRSLYISGFFGDSLQRKVVDIDYYAEMGGTAYATLADTVREDTVAQVYKEFSRRFLEFADVLTYISAKSLTQNEENILRLYENYARTGSEFAKERLLEKGLIAVPRENLGKKGSKQ